MAVLRVNFTTPWSGSANRFISVFTNLSGNPETIVAGLDRTQARAGVVHSAQFNETPNPGHIELLLPIELLRAADGTLATTVYAVGTSTASDSVPADVFPGHRADIQANLGTIALSFIGACTNTHCCAICCQNFTAPVGTCTIAAGACACCEDCGNTTCSCAVVINACEHCGVGGVIAPPVANAATTMNWINGNRIHNNAEGNPVEGRSDLIFNVLDLIDGTRIKPSDIFGFNATATWLEGTETIIAVFSVATGNEDDEELSVSRSPEYRSPSSISAVTEADRVGIARLVDGTRRFRDFTFAHGATGVAGVYTPAATPTAFTTDDDVEIFDVTLYTHTAHPQRFRVDTITILGAQGAVLGRSTFNTETNTWGALQSPIACVKCVHDVCSEALCQPCIEDCEHPEASARTNIITAATCLTAGSQQRVCGTVGCTHTFGEPTEIAALGHLNPHEAAAWSVTTAARCGVAGTESATCGRDGCDVAVTRPVAALEHDFTGWTPQVTQATCRQAFAQTQTCMRDGCTESNSRQSTPASCGIAGCDTCGGVTCTGNPATCTIEGCQECATVDRTCGGATCTNVNCTPGADCARGQVDRTCGGANCTNVNCTPGADCARAANCTPGTPCGNCANCNPENCECNNCADCGFNGGKFGIGRVQGNPGNPEIGDALQILRAVIGLSSVFDATSEIRADALIAANITQRGTVITPTGVEIGDALQILRFVIDLSTQDDWGARYR
jgi:hypothetical protein